MITVLCVCSFNVKGSLTKVEGQRVTVSNKECVPTVSGALVSSKANSSVTALQASSQRWVPPHIIKDSEKSNDAVFRRVRGILNKLTPEKFDKLTSELLHVGIDTKFILKGIILLVFEKALDEPKFSSLYAQLCLRFTELAPNFDDPGKAGHSTFRRLLLKQCEEEFNSRSTASAALDKKDGVLSSEEEEQRAIIKRKMLGNIKFIGELGKLGMLHEAILHKCIKQLLDKKKRATMADISEDMECLCHLMKTVGSQIDVLKARPLMNQYFDRIQHILDNMELPSRIRFMLQDILELRNNKWVPRRADQENSAPRPIQQIRQEAWQGKKGSMHHDHRHMMHHHGDPTFNYGLRHKRGHHHKATVGRGFDDVFMTDASFDSFLPMDDFGHLRMNNPFGAQNFSASRFNDLPPVRPFKEDDPYFSSMRSRNSPPDFLPNYQTGLKKTQPNEGRPRRIGQKPQRLTPDGEISLRPTRESFVAQPTPTASRGGTTSSSLSNNHNKTTSNSSDRSNASSVPDKSKPIKQTPVVPKVDTEKAVVTITEEFVKSKNMTEAIKSVKELNSPQFMDLLTTRLLETILQKSEEEHHLVGELFEKIFEEKLMTKEILTKGFDSFIRNLRNSEKESDVIKMSLAKLSAKFIIKGVFDLEALSKAMEPVAVLFLQCLKEVKEDKGEVWLLETFDKSEVNLMASLPEANRNNEKMTEVLQQQGLIFLSPLLKAQADLFAEIQNDPNVSSLYKWIKDNIDVKLHSSAAFANVLTTCVLKYVTMTTSLAPGIDPKQTIEKNIQDQEKAAMESMKPLLQKFLNDNVLQVSALYALQVFCHCNDFPKGLLLRMFVMLYDFEIIEEDAFISWKEDVNEEHPGKGRALFQVNAWLTWLETAAEESSESEPE